MGMPVWQTVCTHAMLLETSELAINFWCKVTTLPISIPGHAAQVHLQALKICLALQPYSRPTAIKLYCGVKLISGLTPDVSQAVVLVTLPDAQFSSLSVPPT